MNRITRTARTWALSLAAAGCAAGLATAPVASAQLPAGMSPQDVQSAIAAPISVPAGETVTVDLGVPVSMSHAGDGWSVSSAGTSVTVTAPSTPGAQVSVPASALGQSATITLVAEENASLPAAIAPEAGATTGGGDGTGGGEVAEGGAADPAQESGTTANPKAGRGGDPAGTDPGSDSTAVAAAPAPERTTAGVVSDTEARHVELDAVIEGRSISAQLGLGLAADLYRQFQGIDQESVTLRYVDVNGQIIEGVTRDVDMASRTLTLTYPEGQTPDNPFILQVVRDGEAILVVKLVAEDQPVARADDSADEPVEASASSDSPVPAAAVIIAIAALVAIVAVVAAVAARSRRSRQG
ncbi:hypothetical protein [Corynebacterium guangdongense]|uniref:Uncharacterized protein n=1 Tax=Corynebacterium guangdongense TaxID=1783348 RepID=A0ABU1ZY09_9CORY|nr:hypothetical protein [Corynebacterium guangdongense]MDR7329278.1 hypothetical protein [Corynebacterium guangdongense]WJZ17844.1 hypothetical protein CGUA_06365 [Corynebacterium guangdongense]